MSVCIQYSRPASGQDDGEIFGFDVAVTNFLRAYFRHSAEPQFICRPTDIPSFDHFKQIAAAEGVDVDNRCVGLDPRHPEKNLQSISCMFRPDPLIEDLVWRRQQMRGRGFAACGLVHTMSGERIARAVGDLCVAPTDEHDALICPSNSIKDAVRTLWEINCDYLNKRFGGNFSCPVQTPVIPLGIDSGKFEALSSAEKRVEQRSKLGASDDEIIILFVGRLSFATKAHPLPMFLAAEKAAQQTGVKTRLVMFGYFKPKDMGPLFRDLATAIGKTVSIEFVPNDDPRFPDGLWAAADIFTSLSDNVQESFGLTPIEAMACGLPAVVTDWDGYREGVHNGSEGFLVPTMTPPPAAGMDLARLYYNEENYGVALAATSQSTGVDIEWCAKAYATLIGDAELRRTFGENGKKRARDVFDWKRVIVLYDELWASLAEKRLACSKTQSLPDNWQAMHPAFPNPWHMFKSFPTTHLLPTDILRVAMSAQEVAAIMDCGMNYFVPGLLLPKEQMLELVEVVRRAGAVRMQDVLAAFPVDAHSLLWRCIGWMIKHGVCSMERRAGQ